FATSIASSTVLKVMAESTGPKISSRAIDIPGFALEHRRLDEVAAAVLADATSADPNTRAVPAARVDVAEHALHLSFVHDGAELGGGIERVAGLEAAADRL